MCEIGIEIDRMSSTLNGNILIRVKETKNGAKQKLVGTIMDQLKTVENEAVITKTKGIVLTDVDCDIDHEQLTNTLSNLLGIAKEEIQSNPFRYMRRGNQMVTVFLPSEAADRAINLKKIKIGWTSCLVKERVEPPFCRKCQIFGNTTPNCKETTFKPRRCLGCGEGHPTKECTSNKEFCVTCNTDGHRANSMRCPTYKRLVNAKP